MSERHAVSDRRKPYVRETFCPNKAERFHAEPNALPANLREAYALVREAIQRDAEFGAAWKLGGTTPGTRAAFKVDKVYFGPLHRTEILSEPRVAHLGHLCELKGEVEIALRLAPRANAVSMDDLSTLRDPESLFDAWCVALELPASAIANLPDAGVTALIADRCAAGALVLGKARPLSDRAWQEKRTIVVTQNGEEISRGDVSNLVASPVQCAVDFLSEAVANGFSVRAGQSISTGGLTPCVPLSLGRHITIRHGEDVVLDFDLRD